MSAAALALCLMATPALADVWVNPHVRKDGTYVEGHWRTEPNATRLDNYSTQYNVNPYNGKRGTADPVPITPKKPNTGIDITPYLPPKPIVPVPVPHSSYPKSRLGSH